MIRLQGHSLDDALPVSSWQSSVLKMQPTEERANKKGSDLEKVPHTSIETNHCSPYNMYKPMLVCARTHTHN